GGNRLRAQERTTHDAARLDVDANRDAERGPDAGDETQRPEREDPRHADARGYRPQQRRRVHCATEGPRQPGVPRIAGVQGWGRGRRHVRIVPVRRRCAEPGTCSTVQPVTERLDISTEHCTIERDGAVVILTMNQPRKKNALSSSMLAGLVLGYEYV